MVKLGKKKLAELSEISKRKSAACSDSDENPKNGATISSDDESESVSKEHSDKVEMSSKRQRASTASTKIIVDDSDTDESDDLPLNGSKATSSSAPPRKKQKKTPKSKGKATAAEKNQNKKTPTKAANSESDNNDNDDDRDDADENVTTEFEVEAIVGHKSKRGESFFLVRWKGYGKDDDSWEPEAELNCDDLIEEYRKKNSSKKSAGAGKKSPAAAKGVRGRKSGKSVSSDPDKEWAVERILDSANDDEHGVLYRIRWKGFGAKEDTWEPESNLSCEGLIEKFKKNLAEQRNVDAKQLRESPKKTKRLVNETIPRSNLHNRIERSSKRAAAKNRVFYGEE
ncbi:heterochromatin protein 1 [Drosophila hydei]|uniref:Heterochromatin protein 1 n=1 Tax=Drosophila hydei TaxID=7224 RepID=A0A6J1M5M4_DROHY|nr:heterochromatin protein 1 [Drosophila hydei]